MSGVKKRSEPGGPYYDKKGRKLPEPIHRFEIGWAKRCNNCQRPIPENTSAEMRNFGSPFTKTQGPLCPHCAELPPEEVNTRNQPLSNARDRKGYWW